jgi:hypothetical protein
MTVRPTIAVVYKAKWGKKVKLKVFTDLAYPDKIVSSRSTLLPKGSEILEIGVGKAFIEKYKKKYKI